VCGVSLFVCHAVQLVAQQLDRLRLDVVVIEVVVGMGPVWTDMCATNCIV